MTRETIGLLLAAVALSGCKSDATAPPAGETAAPAVSASSAPPAPLASLSFFPAMKTPPPNPLTAAKIALGKLLFFDKRLGSNAACADCHQPDRGFADGIARSTRASGVVNERHTPTLFNVGYQKTWGWDGRSPTLEAHVDEEWAAQLSVSPTDAAARLAEDPGYAPGFVAAYGDAAITKTRITHALASFVRSIRSGDAPYDRFELGETGAVDEAAQRGWEIFRSKAGCAACHVPPLYTDHLFHNIGVGFGGDAEGEPGRSAVSKRPSDRGRFKTPTLRSVASTAPYFHDGSAATLEAAVDYVLGGGHANPNLDSGVTKIVLTAVQRDDLIAFIRSLDPAAPP